MRIKHTQLLSGAQSGDDKFAQLVINSGNIKPAVLNLLSFTYPFISLTTISRTPNINLEYK